VKNLLLALACVALFAARPALAQNPEDVAGKAVKLKPGDKGYTTALVIEPNSGQVLFEDNADTPVPTASMVKMMTCLIVMEEIRDGRLTLQTPVPISAKASKMGGSQIYAKEGQTFPVETLLAATMVQSANDAAVALAEKVAGSTEAFADRMNQRGKQMGLQHSQFFDPHGLPAKGEREDVMSARDLAKLGIELMKFPLMKQYAGMKTMPFTNATFTSGLTNPNHLLRDYPGTYGIKTGYTVNAGFSVTAGAERDGMNVIAVVTGAKTSRGPNSSFAIAARLMDKAFAASTFVTKTKKGAVVGKATVDGGMPATVDAVASADVGAVVTRGQESSVTTTFQDGHPKAPVKQGQQVGTIVVKVGDKEVAKVPAMAAGAVEVRPWWHFWSFGGK
jgi:D-alanyl-D-alanine carboxypeptidase (penicillin-binding protein 5/6)